MIKPYVNRHKTSDTSGRQYSGIQQRRLSYARTSIENCVIIAQHALRQLAYVLVAAIQDFSLTVGVKTFPWISFIKIHSH